MNNLTEISDISKMSDCLDQVSFGYYFIYSYIFIATMFYSFYQISIILRKCNRVNSVDILLLVFFVLGSMFYLAMFIISLTDLVLKIVKCVGVR